MADEPRPMSQDEIDSLFAELGEQESTPPDQPNVEEVSGDHPAGLRPTEIDNLLEEVSQAQDELNSNRDVDEAIQQASAAGPPPPPPIDEDDGDGIEDMIAAMNPAEAPTVVPDAGPMSQDAIDDLLGSLDTGQTASQPDMPAAVPEPKAVTGPLDQGSIDDLLNQLDAGAAAEAPAAGADKPVTGPMDQDGIDALLDQLDMGDAAPAAEPAAAEPAPEPGGALDQAGIDALLAGMDGGAAPAPAAEAPAEEPGGALDQAGIDALLAGMDGGAAPPAAEAPAEEPGGALDQAGIDALLAGMDGGAAPAAEEPAAEADAGGALDQAGIDALLSGMNDDTPSLDQAPAANTELDVALSQSDSVLTQSDIDDLLADAGGEPPPDEPQTNALTPDKLAEVMAKHEDDEEDEGETGTGVIDQDDVDALLAQMAEHTHVPDRDEIGAMMSEHEDDIDALLEQAGENNATAVDAVMPTQMGMTLPPGATMVASGAVMSPEELRGSRALLIAAVFLLAMCSVTLFLVVSSVNRLTDELRSGRDSQEVQTDDFTEALQVATSYLNDDDEDQVQRGITFIDRLKQNPAFDEHRDDVTLLLARHYRSKGAHRKAFKEYQEVANRQQELYVDPSFYLEFADSLMLSRKLEQAEEVIYELIANAQYFLNAERADGTERDEKELSHNQQVVRQAYVLLGRLYNRDLESDVEGGDDKVVRATASTDEGTP